MTQPQLMPPDLNYMPDIPAPPGYFQTHSHDDLMWRTTPDTRQFSEEAMVKCLRRFRRGNWGWTPQSPFPAANQRVVDHWTGILVGCYPANGKYICIIQEIGHHIPLALSPEEYLRIFRQPAG